LGIRYSLSGTGAELFDVDQVTGAITVAKCPRNQTDIVISQRKKRQILTTSEELEYSQNDNDNDDENDNVNDKDEDDDKKNVNVTHIGRTGILDMETSTQSMGIEHYITYNVDEHDADISRSILDEVEQEQSHQQSEHTVSGASTSTSPSSQSTKNMFDSKEFVHYDTILNESTTNESMMKSVPKTNSNIGPGKTPCLDYEAQSVYFLSYKVIYFLFYV